MNRRCARPGCSHPAAATLSYDYGAGTVWLDDLFPEPEASAHDLCPAHADGLVVPRGWRRDDRRVGARLVQAPLAS